MADASEALLRHDLTGALEAVPSMRRHMGSENDDTQILPAYSAAQGSE
ncbi:hypothetical protein [Nesterenkonia pannonica]|nr:hypothetical protein [Nesterenkonia pannonica]